MATERTKVLTPPFRVSFPELFEKKSYDGGKAKYSVTMLFYPAKMTEKEKAQFAAMKAVLEEACGVKFSGKTVKEMQAEKPRFNRGMRLGTEKPDLDGYGEGCVFAKASTEMAPGVVDASKIPILKAEDVYPGCWARATVTAYGYDNKSIGVAFGLQNFQKLGDDESFSGRVAAENEDDFDDADKAWEGTEVAPKLDADDPLA